MPEHIAAAKTKKRADEVGSAADGRIYLFGSLIWLVGFFIWFNSLGLPNNAGVRRWVLWSLIPFDLLDVIDPPVVKGEAPWSWWYLLQRVPFAGIAVAIWVGAWGSGSLLLRVAKVHLAGLERLFFSLCLGLSFTSLITLSLGVCGCLDRWLMMIVLACGPLLETVLRRREQQNLAASGGRIRTALLNDWKFASSSAVAIIIPFVIVQMVGAMSPQIDFDVVEYHLGGPKEWFVMGRVTRLPHNVYTNFPFLSEMLILTGMVIYGDWQWGALAGQAAIAGFAPLAAIGLWAAGQRWFSCRIGCLGALIYLTSPWTYRISIIAYAEGSLACYLFASLYAVLLYRQRLLMTEGVDTSAQANPARSSPEELAGGLSELKTSPGRLAWLTGAMSGSAMACKYTGFVSVVIPVGLCLLWSLVKDRRSGRARDWFMVAASFSIGVGLTIGPWLVKNAVATGNPVYPLAYRTFGGVDRDEGLDAKWRRGHAAVRYRNGIERAKDLPIKLADVMANNDWHSPLMFGFAPLSLLWFSRRKVPGERSFRETILQMTWLYVGWQFLTWWVLTHHIDRFYVPMFTSVAFLAGIGACWPAAFPARLVPSKLRIWQLSSAAIIAASVLYNADVMLHLGGFNAGRIDLAAARDIATPNRIRWLNQEFESGRLGPAPTVLCVGEAQMFHARYPYLYDTVFDRCRFEEICSRPASSGQELRDLAEIRADFQRLGITHVDVNWAEIQRYRAPGSYGFAEFVQPERFAELQRLGLLGNSLLNTTDEKTGMVTGQVFPVLN